MDHRWSLLVDRAVVFVALSLKRDTDAQHLDPEQQSDDILVVMNEAVQECTHDGRRRHHQTDRDVNPRAANEITGARGPGVAVAAPGSLRETAVGAMLAASLRHATPNANRSRTGSGWYVAPPMLSSG